MRRATLETGDDGMVAAPSLDDLDGSYILSSSYVSISSGSSSVTRISPTASVAWSRRSWASETRRSATSLLSYWSYQGSSTSSSSPLSSSPRVSDGGASYDFFTTQRGASASTTSSSDDWAFPEEHLDRLTYHQIRRRVEDEEELWNEGSQTSFQLEQQRFGRNFHAVVRPFYWFLWAQGRAPYTWRDNHDGTFIFSDEWEIRGTFFNCASWTVFFTTIFSMYSALGIMMDWGPIHLPPSLTRLVLVREKAMLKRYMPIYFSTLGALIHTFFITITLYTKSDYVMRYLTYWTEALQSLKMDLSIPLLPLRNWLLGTLGFMYLVNLLFACLRLTASAAGGPVIMGYLIFRMSQNDVLIEGENFDGTFDSGYWTGFQVCGGLVFFLAIAWAKGYILLFIIKARGLRNAISMWNGRLYSALLRGGDDAQLLSGRTTLPLLFRDHATLMDLMEGTDGVFGVILESYIFSQCWTVCFENYMFLRSIKWGFSHDGRRFFRRGPEVITTLFTAASSLIVLYWALKAGAEVGDESMAGFECVRRRTLVGDHEDEEFAFLVSLFASYAGYRCPKLYGCGFFYMSKGVMAAVFGVVGCFTVIVFQFSPVFDHSPPLDRHLVGYWLKILEPWVNPTMCRSWSNDYRAYNRCFVRLERDGFDVRQYHMNNPEGLRWNTTYLFGPRL